MNKRVFVTAIGGDVGHSILKTLPNFELFGSDIVDFPVGLLKVKKYFKLPAARDKKYLSELSEILISNDIDFLIPTNEREIEIISNNLHFFSPIKNLKILINNNSIISTFLDKFKTFTFLKDNNFDVPQTYLPFEFFPTKTSQYILKRRKSNGSKDLFIFSDVNELKIYLSKNSVDDFIVQDYIPYDNNEFTIGVFSDGYVTNVITFKRKLENGYTKFVELVNDLSIINISKRLAKILNLRGSINIQLRKFKDKYYIFEINPRISGTTNFRNQLGFKEVEWWIKQKEGIKISPFKCKYNEAIGIREMNEVFLKIK